MVTLEIEYMATGYLDNIPIGKEMCLKGIGVGGGGVTNKNC